MTEAELAVMNNTLNTHSRDIEHFYNKLELLYADLNTIKAALNQIKWVATGGLAFYVIENVGLIEAITR